MEIKNIIIAFAIFLTTTFGIANGAYAATNKNAADYIPNNQVAITVDRLFTQVFGRKPDPDESLWWKYRARTDKNTESGLLDTMKYFRVNKWTYSSIPQKITTAKLVDCVFDDNSGVHHEYKNITQSDCSVEQAIWYTVKVPTYTYQPLSTPIYYPSSSSGVQNFANSISQYSKLPPLVFPTPIPTPNYYNGNRCSAYNRSINPSGCF